jgi:hypothetical protein
MDLNVITLLQKNILPLSCVREEWECNENKLSIGHLIQLGEKCCTAF